MQFGSVWTDPKCARCSRPVYVHGSCYMDGIWYHYHCYEEGKRQLKRAQEMADRFLEENKV